MLNYKKDVLGTIIQCTDRGKNAVVLRSLPSRAGWHGTCGYGARAPDGGGPRRREVVVFM